MKSFRHSILFSALPLLLLAASCDLHKEDLAEGEGIGTVVVNISSPDGLETRHQNNEGSPASDGGKMKTLRVWFIEKTSGKILDRKDLTLSDATTATVKFEEISRGSYYLCAVSNYTGLDSYVKGGTVDDAGFKNALIAAAATTTTTTTTTTNNNTLEAGQAPYFSDETGMPASYFKEISVAAGANTVDASLKRCVGRLTIDIRNTTSDYELFVHSLNLSANNRTQGYLFPRLNATDSSIPGTSSMVTFPDLTSLVQVPPTTETEVYDYYLFETNPGTALTINMLAALYPKNTEASSVKVSSRSEESTEIGGNTSAIGTSFNYLIRSAYSSNYYLGVTTSSSGGGRGQSGRTSYSLTMTQFSSDDDIKGSTSLNNYLWKFSGSTGNSTTIQNVGTGRYLTISSSSASVSSSVSTPSTSSSSTFIAKESSQYGVRFTWDNYNLSYNGSSISVTEDIQNNKQVLWYVRPVRTGDPNKLKYYFDTPDDGVKPTAELPRGYHEIKYLDVYGAPQPLTKIDRNEHVTLHVNLFYNAELGQFDFEVAEWEDGGDRETTFD